MMRISQYVLHCRKWPSFGSDDDFTVLLLLLIWTCHFLLSFLAILLEVLTLGFFFVLKNTYTARRETAATAAAYSWPNEGAAWFLPCIDFVVELKANQSCLKGHHSTPTDVICSCHNLITCHQLLCWSLLVWVLKVLVQYIVLKLQYKVMHCEASYI